MGMVSTSKLASAIRAAGIQVKRVELGDEELDDEITIDDRVSVQVCLLGPRLAIVGYWETPEKQAMVSMPGRRDVAQVIADLKKAIEVCKA